MGAGGFEPPKHYAADLQSVPIGHSGKLPYSVALIVADNFNSIACLFSKSKPFLKIIKNIICLHLARVLWPRKKPSGVTQCGGHRLFESGNVDLLLGQRPHIFLRRKGRVAAAGAVLEP